MEETRTLSRINESGIATILVDAFIVPNSLATAADLIPARQNDEVNRLLTFNRNNGTNFNVITGKVIQVWFTGDSTCDSENLNDHGFSVIDTDGEVAFARLSSRSDYIPVGIFAGKEEGDVVDVVLPAATQKGKFRVCLRCTLAQTKYRYRQWGRFEECLAKLGG